MAGQQPQTRFPLTRTDLLSSIAVETARMSYPGSMSRGKQQVLRQGAKKKVEEFFANSHLMSDIDTLRKSIEADYDAWHRERCQELGFHLRKHECIGSKRNKADVIAAKLMNTFMYQLMKYGDYRGLWHNLHLPLDARVFSAFRRFKYPVAWRVLEVLGENSAYAITFNDYENIQSLLWDLIADLNARPAAEVQFESRIELNLLWL